MSIVSQAHHHAVFRQPVRQFNHHRLIARRQAGSPQNQATVSLHINRLLTLNHHGHGTQLVVLEIKAFAVPRIDVHPPDGGMGAIHLQSFARRVGMNPCRHRLAKSGEHIERALIPHEPMQVNDVGLKARHNRRNRHAHGHLHAIGNRARCRRGLARPSEHLHTTTQQVANFGINVALRDMRVIKGQIKQPKASRIILHAEILAGCVIDWLIAYERRPKRLAKKIFLGDRRWLIKFHGIIWNCTN